MERYPLEALLSVRHYREEGAKRRVRGAENALREAEAEMEKKKKELEAFRIWRVEEEDRRYAAIMGVPMRMEKLDAFKNGLALLVAQENDKEQAVVLAGKEVERRKEELLHAQEAVKTARKNTSKIQAHKDIWQEEAKKEAEHKEDLELEEFRPISRKGAEAEGEDA
ncbi:YscO family type III secretion system apparatus protein [uncultured Mailhella sp.]|uniref:type III secretion system stalk subunit SctO n=1 Tax=uncultured Mailhella sp. TaxID=1981031 RepID=UPI0025DF2805|nr:YscO family type III secretion system apparatus protein [uncultured Mailhella sp.]